MGSEGSKQQDPEAAEEMMAARAAIGVIVSFCFFSLRGGDSMIPAYPQAFDPLMLPLHLSNHSSNGSIILGCQRLRCAKRAPT